MQDEQVAGGRFQAWFHVAAMVLSGVYAGVLLGCSFLATPVKFLAPTLSRSAAMDVGRVTFGVLEKVEWALAPAVLIALWLAWRMGWRVVLGACVVMIVAIQTLWLLPVLNSHVQMIIEAQTPPSTIHHLLYGIGEIAKVAILLGLAIADGLALADNLSSA